MKKEENKKINTKEELINSLGVGNISEIEGDKLNKFVKMIPDVNPELVGQVIAAIPASTDALARMASELSNIYNEQYKVVVGDNETIKAYKDILEVIKQKASVEDLSFEEQSKYIEEMKKLAVEISKEERVKEEYNKQMREYTTKFIILIVIIFSITLALVIVCIFVPGFIDDIVVGLPGVIIGIIALAIVITSYFLKKRKMELKYKK